MRDILGPGSRLGYCTNVHAGEGLAATLSNLQEHATRVRERLGLAEELYIGLWLSASAAREACRDIQGVKARLTALKLRVFTLNGFPYGDFHSEVVKHAVYRPDWADPRRLEYTLDLIKVLHGLLEAGEEGSISTLPIGWPGAPCAPIDLSGAAHQLSAVAERLWLLEESTGRLIHLDLEPEPGCILEKSADAVAFFEERLLGVPARDEWRMRRYLRVCHDICHAAVVFEGQAEAFLRYQRAGLSVGKVQISSALCVRFADMRPGARQRALAELRGFDEARYLHQTRVRDGRVTGFDDLPQALAVASEKTGPGGEWRVHFHVPVHLPSIGLLGTSQEQIPGCLDLARKAGVKHFEVETYAWGVLPEAMRPPDLASGIAQELQWVRGVAGLSGMAGAGGAS